MTDEALNLKPPFTSLISVDLAGLSHQGLVRQPNEDHYLIVLHTSDWILRQGRIERNEMMWRMADRFRTVNAELLREAPQVGLTGMSSTLTAAVSLGDDLIVTNIGDSRAYVQRGETLTQLSRDHSLAQKMIDDGDLALANGGSDNVTALVGRYSIPERTLVATT